MKRALAFVLLTFSALAIAQAPQIKRNATVYIAPAGGYEAEVAAALMKEKVPLVVVADEHKADYILMDNIRRRNGQDVAWADRASITVIHARTSQIVFAASASTKNCAKQLKKSIK